MADNIKNYIEWFKKADDDGQAAEIILKEGGLYGIACFHSQQMAEKYLKGLLIFLKISFPKVHDLLELETLIVKSIPEIKEYENDMDLLNSFYIETRYPGDFPEFSADEAQKALEAALKIKEFVLNKIEVLES